jgi:uncharacterized membrane protein
MNHEPEEGGEPRASTGMLRYILRRMYAVRPASFYLLLALFIMLPLGTQMIGSRENPQRFALFVSLHLIFLFVVLVRAVFDIAEIARDHLREREGLFRTTLGDRNFAKELGRQVTKHRDEP